MQEIITVASKSVCPQEFRIVNASGQEIHFCIGRSRRFYEKGMIEELFFSESFGGPFSKIVKRKNMLIFFGKDGSEFEVKVRHVSCKHENGLVKNRFIVI